MNRRDFIEKLGLGVAIAVVVPTVIAQPVGDLTMEVIPLPVATPVDLQKLLNHYNAQLMKQLRDYNNGRPMGADGTGRLYVWTPSKGFMCEDE